MHLLTYKNKRNLLVKFYIVTGKVPKHSYNLFWKNVKILHYFSWFFGKIGRAETQKLLLAEVNNHGSFLIRESESVPNTYALSLRDTNAVRHYKIKRLDSGNFFISKSHDFESLQAMVEFYLREPEGLCCKLGAPCMKVSLSK